MNPQRYPGMIYSIFGGLSAFPIHNYILSYAIIDCIFHCSIMKRTFNDTFQVLLKVTIQDLPDNWNTD